MNKRELEAALYNEQMSRRREVKQLEGMLPATKDDIDDLERRIEWLEERVCRCEH